jgi:hypothetical protein
MSQTSFVAHEPAEGAISLINATIVVDCEDFEGVRIAASTLAKDIARVTGEEEPAISSEQCASPYAVIIGSVQRSTLIQHLVSSGKIDIAIVEGKWETWCTTLVDKPWNGCTEGLVILGSDKRGTIFGIYSMSEQMGVSP